MAFGGGGGFSFGNNNNNQSTGFGGFGNNNNNTGFGASTTNTGFGSSTAGTNPFGGGTSTFGSNTGGFGSTTANAGSSLFGANKPATNNPFGSNTGTTSLFGGNNNTTNTGGFGSSGFGNTTNTGGFGSTNNNAGSAFSFGNNNNNNKPAFGSSTTTPLFGQGGTGTTGGFGTTSTFGAGTGTALNQPVGPSDGTASTPFAPTTEKESNGVSNNYQSINFQAPYAKYSFEELRLADYNAGRQFGNGSGQAGAFGTNAFGGFNTGNTGGFGSNNTGTNPFGATTSATTFGNNTATSGFGGGTGLFGNTANKPAGGLFGATTTSAGTTGGLFGTSNNNTTTTGFGGGTTGFGANTGTTGGLFGQNNQNKPAGGLFGNTTGTTNNAFSFGQNNNTNTGAATGGGLFGNNNATNTGTSLFGNNNQTQQNTTGGLFGNTNNNTQGNSLFGANKTGTGFGTQASTGTTGGLFGSPANNTGTTGGLFGNTNTAANTNTGTGLFGNTANTGGGLFGNNNNNTNQAASKPLFGSGFGTNATANTGGGLFSNTNNATNNQSTGGLFGNNNTGGGFSFGNNNANKPNTGLFGNSNNNQQGGGLFGSSNTGLFGQSQNSQQQNQQQQQDGIKHASLLDPNPYGQSSIWTGLPAPTPENSKPVFTPLTATQKLKESSMKPPPSLKLNQSRYMTPPRRNGFGFSYSTYGTPNSAASTPGGAGLSGSMYGSRGFSGGSFGRSFNKSASVQNLRSQFTSDSDDIWKPGAFASTHRNSGGSIKRLTIDRSIRNDLFSRPSLPALPTTEHHSISNNSNTVLSPTSQTNGESHQDTSNKLKKRVSFENGTSGGLQNSQLNGESGALVRTERDEDEVEETTGRSNGATKETQSRSKDLDAVPEDRESHSISKPAPSKVQATADPKPGDYWMSPSRAEQSKLPREQLKAFKDFQVGRVGCGQVTFNGTVDLTALPMADLYDTIVEIRVRSVTVYPDVSMKPPVGKGLNVPSTIVIENSWPRSRNQPSSATSGPLFDKHIQRLKKMPGTDFVGYKVEAGIWTFRVPHYTRYGLDYDDDEEELTELTTPPDSIERSAMDVDANESDEGNDYDDEDDTFAFRQKIVPGGFGRQSAVDYEPTSTAPAANTEQDNESDRSAYSDEEMSEDEPSIVGSFPAPTHDFNSPNKPNMRSVQRGTPGKALLDLEGDWAEQLQRTISPRKQNRDMLRETQNKVLIDRVYSPIKPKTIEKKDFRTSIDVMNSLFGLRNEPGNSGARQRNTAEPEFEFPYAKRAKTFDSSLDDLSEADRKWHESFRTQFTNIGDLVYRKSAGGTTQQKEYSEEKLVSNRGGVVVKSSLRDSSDAFNLTSALRCTEIVLENAVPHARRQKVPFSRLAEGLNSTSDDRVESDIYNLLHILFDDYEDEFTHGLPHDIRQQYEPQIRKDRLTKFLSSYVIRKHSEKLSKVEKESPTVAAIIKLTAKDIKGACDLLEKAKNYKLMILVSQLENADRTFQDDVKAQIDAWREQRVLSEMTEDVRTLYELCAGNTTISAGKSGNHIPVEDKAKTFSISDEYGLDWIQSFALGLWYGRGEKSHASATGFVSIENAVVEFSRRCDSQEESQTPGTDPIWIMLELYATKQGAMQFDEIPLPTALEGLNKTWDASKAFNLHYSIVTNIGGTVEQEAEEDLTGLLAYQLSSKGDIAAAAYTLLHLDDPRKRESMLQNLLERFAGQLPDPPSSSATNAPNSEAVSTIVAAADASTAELWTVLTRDLRLPESWLYNAKALYARSVSADSTRELQYLVAAKSWDAAHDCFARRVAPALVVDDDIALLNKTADLFDSDVLTKTSHWEMGGGIYADYGQLRTATRELNQPAVEMLAQRLVELGRRLKKTADVDLGKLSVEELEERVAVHEMSRVVADAMSSAKDVKHKEILELPITSDQRLVHTMAMANKYFRGVTAGGDA